jgi:hypothetical protein
MKKLCFLLIGLACQAIALPAQEPVYKDPTGRLKWSKGKADAFFWGVNYTAPFAHAYRQLARNGVDHRQAIDADVYHLSRMGINAFRIHVWDCEISDSVGNLLDNEHLNLLDYLIHRLQQRGIYTLLTPIAYWGNGYPEPNEPLLGFSGRYNKGNAYTDSAAIAAQERYLTQFVNHLNPYSGKRYKNDPMIIAFEVCNEPSHSKAKETTAFVQRMCAAIRSTGCKKSVMYNVTQSIGLLENFIAGGADGVTFQWYPTGLVAGRERQGNFLPHVDNYDMPFKNEKYFANQTRIVYEFDAADVGRSYLFPPIAISFKEAGMQWVTQFSYDPAAMASSNTEYQTHFLNLIYAPQKAIGFKSAGELFRNPQYKRDRANEKELFAMNGVTISYQKDLAVLSSDKLFFYTNNTDVRPNNPATLQSVVGYGSSPMVDYRGRGAYFLDKVSSEVWRLEVLPDAVWIRDPFSRATPRVENVVIKYNEYPMTVRLPDLGDSFYVTGVNHENSYAARAANGQFTVTPGAYMLSAKPFIGNPQQLKVGTIAVNEFYAPAETDKKQHFLHQPQKMAMEGQPLRIAVEVLHPTPIKQLTLLPTVGRGRGVRPLSLPMSKHDGYLYSATIPDSMVRPGLLSYTVKVELISGQEIVYPGAVEGPTNTWDYYNPEVYSIKVLPAQSGVELYSAENSEFPIVWSVGNKLQLRTVYFGIVGETTAKLVPTGGRQGASRGDDRAKAVFAMECFVKPQIEAIAKYAHNYSRLVICAKAENEPIHVEVTLVCKNGDAYTGTATLTSNQARQTVALSDLAAGKMLLLPRPYPGFLPFWYANHKSQSLDIREVERLQLVIPTEGNAENPLFELKSIAIE